MKPTHLHPKTEQPAIVFRPAISVTGNMIIYCIAEMISAARGKLKGKAIPTEENVKARITELLQDVGPTVMESTAAGHPEHELAEAYGLVLFPDFMARGGSLEAVSQAKALVFASQTSNKPEGGKKGKKAAQDQDAENQD